jgi:hypothetical protein
VGTRVFFNKILIFKKKFLFSDGKFGAFFQRKIVEFPVEKPKKIQKIPNFIVGKIVYFPKKISGDAGEQSFRKIGDLFP